MSPADAHPSWSALLLLLPSSLLGYFIYGRLIFLALPSPLPWATGFVGSFLGLFGCVLVFDFFGLPVTLISLGGSLALLALGGWLFAGHPVLQLQLHPFRLHWSRLIWLAPCALMVISIPAQAWLNPLAGWDNIFRWNYLALLVREQGSLAHYPPVSAADFRVYPWSDGIPPGVPFLNLWLYLSTGSSAGVLVVGRIATEVALIVALTWRLAKRLHGEAGACIALVALSTSALFAWSIGFAQETGATAVFLLILVNLLHDYRGNPTRATAIWIGLAAAAAALCRDYNLVFPPLALGLLLHARAPRRDLLAAAGATLLATIPWYIRNAWITGNPLYPHDFGGLLATNPYHADMMVRVSAFWSPLHRHEAIPALLAALTVGAGLLGLAALAGLRRRDQRQIDVAVILLAVVTLWLISMPKTAGGWNYSLRVLGATAPLLAVIASTSGPRLSKRGLLWVSILALPFSADAARRSWIFINAPLESPWPFDWKTFRAYQPTLAAVQDPESFQALIAIAEGEGIVLDQPNYVVGVRNRGGSAISIFSPEVTSLTQSSASTPISQTVAELRAHKIRFVVLTQQDDFNTFCALFHPSMRRLWLLPPTLDLGAVRLYDLAVMNNETPARQVIPPAP
jgi:hypothetical protein